MAPKFACFLCQEYTEHQTKNCPNLKCKRCGQLGHARKDCQSISTSCQSCVLTRTIEHNENFKRHSESGLTRSDYDQAADFQMCMKTTQTSAFYCIYTKRILFKRNVRRKKV